MNKIEVLKLTFNVNFKTSKMDCRCHSFPLFRLIVVAFQEDCCQFSGLWRLALLPLGRPLIWKIYQTSFHCKQSQNLWTPCFKIWWTLGFIFLETRSNCEARKCHVGLSLKLPHQKKEDSNIPFPGKVSQNTPPRERYPALPSPRLQPTSIAACFTSLNSPCAAYVRTKGILWS